MDEHLPMNRPSGDLSRTEQAATDLKPRDEASNVAKTLNVGNIHATTVNIYVQNREERATHVEDKSTHYRQENTRVEDRSTHTTQVKKEHYQPTTVSAPRYQPTTVSAPSYHETQVSAPRYQPTTVSAPRHGATVVAPGPARHSVGTLGCAALLVVAALVFLAGFAFRAMTDPAKPATTVVVPVTPGHRIPRSFGEYLDE